MRNTVRYRGLAPGAHRLPGTFAGHKSAVEFGLHKALGKSEGHKGFGEFGLHKGPGEFGGHKVQPMV